MQPRRGSDHPQVAAAHAEPPRIDGRRGLHLQLLADLSHGRVELEWNDDARRFKAALDVQRPVAGVANTGGLNRT